MTEHRRVEYPESLREVSNELRLLTSEEVLSGRLEHLLRVAAEIGETNIAEVVGFIQEHLLPYCLLEPTEGDQSASPRGSRLRQQLRSWLNSLSDDVMWSVRIPILESIVADISVKPKFASLYTLATIGYRSELTVSALRAVAAQDSRLGHEALRLLVQMEPDDADREWISERIAQTPPEARTDGLFAAAALLHDPRWLTMLTDAAAGEMYPMFGLSRIVWLGEEAPGDEELQDTVWSAVLNAVNARTNRPVDLFVIGGVAGKCHSRNVIPSLGSHLNDIHLTAVVHPIRWAERVREAVSPTQLSGWSAVDPNEVARVFLPLLETNSGPESVGLTADGYTKEIALDTLLCSRNRDVLRMPDIALRDENNPYMSAHVMNQFAVLALPDMPDAARRILAQFPGTARKSQNNAELVAFFGSARLAASSTSREALELLLRSHGTTDGHPFTVPVEDAAEQAAWRVTTGSEDVIPLLLDAVVSPSLVAQSIAVGALGRIASSQTPVVIENIDSVLQSVATDTTRETYVRVEALSGLVELHRKPNQAQHIGALLTTIATEQTGSLSGAAVSALVSVGLLESQRAFIESVVGLDPDRAAYLAGQLAQSDPQRYESEAILLLRSGSDGVVHQVLAGFTFEQGHRLTGQMAEVLIERVARDETQFSGNPRLIDDLASLAPDRLLAWPWETVWNGWMPTSREVLASALERTASHEPTLRPRAVVLLGMLILDGVYSVRRSAMRAFSRIDLEQLRTWSTNALDSGSIRLRAIGVEAAGWIPIDSNRTLDNDLLRRAAHDLERNVREAAQQSRQDMRKRRWSAELMDAILIPRPDPSDWVLQGYALGRALASMGDDEDLLKLQTMSRDTGLPPNVRYWLGLVAKNLEKQWRKTTEGWPASTYSWPGVREHMNGTISVDDVKHDAAIDLWRVHPSTPNGRDSWGGAATFVSFETTFRAVHAKRVALEVSDRPSTQIAVVESSGRRIIFFGNGEYPDGN